jgi:hypothetical protein
MSEIESPLANPYPAEIRLILWQTLAFIVRVGQFGVAVGTHRLVHVYILPLAIPEAWQKYLLPLFAVMFFAAFAVMYTQQMYDMATIVVPWLRQKRPPAEAE